MYTLSLVMARNFAIFLEETTDRVRVGFIEIRTEAAKLLKSGSR